jgi:mannan endo-1,4-beta-mannosidase
MKYAIHPALQFAPGQYDEDLWGINFWTYSGEGIPPHPGEYWKKGDIFTGDPPHELQGWYGVYSTDSSTLSIISGASEKINKQ